MKKTIEEAELEDFCIPKKTGEAKVVGYEIDGLINSYCTCSEWTNGEGFDISFETKNSSGFSESRISLHTDELDTMLACLNELGYFEL